MKDYYLLVGLNSKEVKIININQKEPGLIEVVIENRKQKVRCPVCNKFTSSVHGKLKPIKSIYLDSCGSSVDLIIYKKRYHCYNCNKIFTEKLNINTSNGSISNKVKIQIRRDLLNYNLSLKYIAEKNRVSITTIENEMLDIVSSIPKHVVNLPRVISFDEFKADTTEGKYAFILNDPIHKKVLDILPKRKKEYLLQYFIHCNNRYSVEFVISDMYEPYLLVQQIMFPHAKYVVDRFHYTRYIMDALDKVRIRLQKEYGYNSKEYRMLKNKKNITLLRKYSNDIDWWTYTKRYKNKHMVDVLKYDLREELLALNHELHQAYVLKELFLDLLSYSDYEHAEEEIKEWIRVCKDCGLDEFEEASKTINNWLPYIVNSFIDKRFSNGFTEGLNNKIKVIKRVAFGYKNFKFFRIRLMYILNGKVSGISKKDRNRKK